LIASWGFEYKTVAFTWVKKNKKSDSWFWGMGNWTRANAEVCLLATKGKPKRISAAVHSIISTPVRKHSQKPDEARDRIVQLLGDLPRIELFAREETAGWDVWGDEI
jgi:N6-adenosine-specific RNA methylase IME4